MSDDLLRLSDGTALSIPIPAGAESISDLLHLSDGTAMYFAKREGEDCYRQVAVTTVGGLSAMYVDGEYVGLWLDGEPAVLPDSHEPADVERWLDS